MFLFDKLIQVFCVLRTSSVIVFHMHPLMHLINGTQSVQKAIGVSVYTNI